MPSLSATCVYTHTHTLIHIHRFSALTINGLASRGNPILGLSRFRENSTQLPYTTLIYGNGPGNHQPRKDPAQGPNSTDSPYYVQYAAIHQEEAFHDGSDVAMFAAGPFAHLFQGVQEQSYIAHVFAYAMCIGDYTNQAHCRQTSTTGDDYLGSNSMGADSSIQTTVINNPSLGRYPYNDDRLNQAPNKPVRMAAERITITTNIKLLLCTTIVSVLFLLPSNPIGQGNLLLFRSNSRDGSTK